MEILKQRNAYKELVNSQARLTAQYRRKTLSPTPIKPPKIDVVPDEVLYKHDPTTCKANHGRPPLPKVKKKPPLPPGSNLVQSTPEIKKF
jgi:hypothetical protein